MLRLKCIRLAIAALSVVLPLPHSTAYAVEPARDLSRLAVDTRGELVLDVRGEVLYKHWTLERLQSSAHIGMLMVLPARVSTRKQIAPLEDAITAKDYDYRRLSSTSIVNLADATLGAGMMVEGKLISEKKAEPDVHFVVDEKGQVRRMLELPEGTIHVLLYNCRSEVLYHQEGGFTVAQAQQFVERIDNAIRDAPCGGTSMTGP